MFLPPMIRRQNWRWLRCLTSCFDCRRLCQVAISAIFFTNLVALSLGADSSVSFARDIRPLLSRHCFLCHGPDENSRQAGLRLDTRGGFAHADTNGFHIDNGRTIFCQGELANTNYGRDHHGRCFTVWLSGGGVKPGISYGRTDEFCYNVAEDPVHVHDLNATILHCLGIDRQRLQFPFQGLRQCLTGVERKSGVVHGVLL